MGQTLFTARFNSRITYENTCITVLVRMCVYGLDHIGILSRPIFTYTYYHTVEGWR